MKFTITAAICCAAILVFSVVIASHNSPEALEQRVSAVGKLNVGGGTAGSSESDSAGPADGESIYNATCTACHGTGIAGAPKFGDAVAWAPRLETGLEIMIERAIAGFTGETGVMPAKGGNPNLSDEAVTAAVQFIVDNSQ